MRADTTPWPGPGSHETFFGHADVALSAWVKEGSILIRVARERKDLRWQIGVKREKSNALVYLNSHDLEPTYHLK